MYRTQHPTPSQYTDTGNDTPPRHSLQTQGRPVVVLSIDVEHHTVIYNYTFQCLGSDPIGKSFPNRHHTYQLTLNFMMLVWWSSVRSSIESVPYPPGLDLRNSDVGIHYTFHLPTSASHAIFNKIIHLQSI